MSVASEVVAGGPGITSPAAAAKRDHTFYCVMAGIAAVTVFAGFAPTYFLRSFSDRPALSPLLHLHGLVFTSWVVLFVTQVSLVATRRVALHRRLGVLGLVIAVSMVVVGTMAAIDAARRGFTPPGAPPPLVFLAIPLGDMVVVSLLVATGLHFRRRPEIHRRVMLVTMLALMTPAIARLPFMPQHILAFLGTTDLLLVACLVYDRITRGRIHPAFLWGTSFVVLSQVARIAIAGTAMWMGFAKWLVA